MEGNDPDPDWSYKTGGNQESSSFATSADLNHADVREGKSDDGIRTGPKCRDRSDTVPRQDRSSSNRQRYYIKS